ncbi:uncharacterized protein LOC131030153 isoform X1 [Cryptomeria japonica]|uniref:uncharacterized protein LOC131030153 isoform X1 n=1 Tax=Cryptomeria japonica TaxID=3369 RepID=UPI0027DA9427|nr:uncharacterized protein LOC131030153 isoform X1 [Cryptomeria japonica]
MDFQWCALDPMPSLEISRVPLFFRCNLQSEEERKNIGVKIQEMKFLGWYIKLAVGFASIGAAMEYFMIQTGFYDKVTVLEAEKRAEELDPRNQAIKEALNPWRKQESMRERDH